VYYGNREVDIAMTKLFGGFDRDFYESYNSEYPLEPGAEERFDLYNLYPLLVHVNLFGGGYLQQVKSCLRRFD
jgi:fructosamine-3-kinase